MAAKPIPLSNIEAYGVRLLAAPASSSADERQFSMASHVLDEEHWHTLDDLAEAWQCLKSLFLEGIHVSLSDRKYANPVVRSVNYANEDDQWNQ